MSLSKEWQDWHLTPAGWSKGTFKHDFGRDEVAAPVDRLLTIRLHEVQSCSFASMHYSQERVWAQEGASLAEALSRHGSNPPGAPPPSK